MEDREAQETDAGSTNCRIVNVFSLAEEPMEMGGDQTDETSNRKQNNDTPTSAPNPAPNANTEEATGGAEVQDVQEIDEQVPEISERDEQIKQTNETAVTGDESLQPVSDSVTDQIEVVREVPEDPEEGQSKVYETNGSSVGTVSSNEKENLTSTTAEDAIDVEFEDVSQALTSTPDEVLDLASAPTQPYLDVCTLVKVERDTNLHVLKSITVPTVEQPSTSTDISTTPSVPTTTDEPPASVHSDEDSATDLLTCQICHSEISNPKSLPCLHTFCQTCLISWSKKCPQILTCPTCQEECPFPQDGIEGLKGNCYVTKLKDRRNLKRKLSSPEKIVCSACDSGIESDSRCLDCEDFLCSNCVNMHETLRILKSHQVIKLTELRSGKVNLFKIPKQQQEQCTKHIGQVMWFYCETCSALICRDCTVVDHCRPEHTYVNLVDAIRGQRQNIKGLSDDCKKILKDVESEIDSLQRHENQLASAVNQAVSGVDSAADRAIADLQECVEEKRNDHLVRIKQIEEERKASIHSHREKLLSLTTRLKTALDLGKHITEDGSEFEIASTFQSLLATFRQLKATKLPVIRNELSKLSFEINEGPLFTIHELGSVKSYDKWTLVSKFGRGNDGSKPITKAWAVTVTKEGDIAVANNSSSGNVSVHGRHPPHQTLLNLETSSGLGRNPSGWKSFPRGVAVTRDGHFYVADNTMFVKEYDSDGKFIQQFGAVHPNGEESDKMKITLDSVAVNKNGELLVGPNQHKFLSVHDAMNCHLRSFYVAVEPHFIATSLLGDEIVISSHIGNSVHVVDGQGNTLHILKSDIIPVWRPRGLCCNKDGEVLVSNAIKDRTGEAAGIYRFTLGGKYLGCLTKDVVVPYGLALSHDEETLVVGDKKMVSVFELR